MNHSSNRFLSNRVLKINVGFLLADGPGHTHESQFDYPAVKLADDLTLNYVRGPVRLSRTKEGILVQAHLEAMVDDECYRCLTPVESVLHLEIEELYLYHSQASAEFRIGEDAILDLAPLLRAEALIQASGRFLCQPECKGLCPECGANLNIAPCDCHLDRIDPRMAALKALLDSQS